MAKHILNRDGTLASGWDKVPPSYRMPWYESPAPEYSDSPKYRSGTIPPKYLVRGVGSWNIKQRATWAFRLQDDARKAARSAMHTGDLRRVTLFRLTNKVMTNKLGDMIPIYRFVEEWGLDPVTNRPKVQLIPQGVPGLQAGEELRFTHITLNTFE